MSNTDDGRVDQNGMPIDRDVRQNPIDGLWYTNVWIGQNFVTNVRRYGYRTRARAEDGDISDYSADSYREPHYEAEARHSDLDTVDHGHDRGRWGLTSPFEREMW